MVFLTICICVGAILFTPLAMKGIPTTQSAYSASFNLDSQGNEIDQLPEMTTDDVTAIVVVVAVILAIWIIVSLIQHGYGITLLIILFAIGAAWFFLLSDKTGDGVGDNQIIAVVQPVGNNVPLDSAYSEVNKGNATANVITAASFGIYAIVFLIFAFGISFLFILKKYR